MHLPHLPLPRTALVAAALALVAGCGGSGDPPPTDPNPNTALSSTQITAAQAMVEPAASTAAAVDTAAAVLTAAQIDHQQRTALERAVITETATPAEKQAALDGGEYLTPEF